MKRYREKLTRDIVIALVVALGLFGLSTLATRTPEGLGFPFTFSNPISTCKIPNPLNGCGFSYHLSTMAADYFFWAIVTFAFVFLIDIGIPKMIATRMTDIEWRERKIATRHLLAGIGSSDGVLRS